MVWKCLFPDLKTKIIYKWVLTYVLTTDILCMISLNEELYKYTYITYLKKQSVVIWTQDPQIPDIWAHKIIKYKSDSNFAPGSRHLCLKLSNYSNKRLLKTSDGIFLRLTVYCKTSLSLKYWRSGFKSQCAWKS